MACKGKLNTDHLRIANVVAFFVNIIMVYGSNLGWYGKTNKEVSDDNASLFTPKERAFAIWGIIFTLQAIYVFMQLSKKVVPSVFVSHVVSIWYICLCIIQPIWSIVFAQEYMITSQILIMASWLVLAFIAKNWITFRMNVYKDSEHNPIPSAAMRALCTLPFTMQYAWVSAAMLANLNVVVSHYVYKNEGTDLHWRLIAAPIVCYGFVIFFALFHSLTQNSLPIVPLVLLWTTFNISDRLTEGNVKERLWAIIDHQTIFALQRAFSFAAWLCAVLFVISLAKDAMWYFSWGRQRLMDIGLLQKLKPGEMIGLNAMIAPCANCEHMRPTAEGDSLVFLNPTGVSAQKSADLSSRSKGSNQQSGLNQQGIAI